MELALIGFFSICVLSALLWHWLVPEYLWATIAASLTTGVAIYLGWYLWRGVMPHALFNVAVIANAFIVSLGVGIPFNRRRTGKGLWPVDDIDG